MAFPTPTATAVGGSATDQVGNHTINIPATNVPDALLIAIFCNDGTATVTGGWPAGWNALLTSELGATSLQRWEIRYKVASGAETNFSLSLSSGESSASITYVIKDWDKNTAPAAGTSVKATTTTPNPPALNPAGWDVEDTLWIAVQCWDDGRTSCTAAPASYTGLINQRPNTAAAGVGVASAVRNNAIASEDPGTFTNNASDPTCANTIAVRPGDFPALTTAIDIRPPQSFFYYI